MNTSGNGQSPDELTRQQVRTRLEENLYLEAGAGTGKTNALVTRLIELLVTKSVPPDQIAAITFTRAAAFEMRSRLRADLEKAAASETDPEKRAHIATVVDNLDSLAIQTIHSFALSMLREQPLEIGLPPVIEPLDDIQGAVEFDNRWSDWFSERIESDRELAPALGVASRLKLRNAIDILRQLAQDLGEQHQHLRSGMFNSGVQQLPTIPTLHLAETLEQIRAIVSTAPDPEDTMCVFVNDDVVPGILSMLSLAGDSGDLPASDFADWPTLKTGRKGSKAKWKRVTDGEANLDRLRSLIDALQTEIDSVLSALRQETLATLLTAAVDFALDYSQHRHRQGRLTFHDQLVLANRLLQNSSEARQRFRQRFRYILVDEFQDTDPVQIDLLHLLAGDENGGLRPGSLFVVGDPKQSIYRFRGADPVSSGGFSSQVAESGDSLPLSENHRSLPGILKWVNTVFAGWMKEGEPAQAPHRSLRWEPEFENLESQLAGVPVWWFGDERDANAGRTRNLEFEEISAIAAAAGEGAFQVRNGKNGWRDSTFADVAILMRSRTGLDVLEDRLISKNVPYVFDSHAPLFTSQDIRDLHACLTAIDDPADQVATLSAIRSPAFSCTDTDLLLWKNTRGRFLYLEKDQPNDPTTVASAFAELQKFHTLSRELDTASLVEMFICERRLREKAMLTRIGPERSRRLDLVVELASALSDPTSGKGSITLRDFTRWLARQSEENAQMPERVSQGTISDAVRVMTIHGAKGLEFPIVIMASANAGKSGNDSVQIRMLRQNGTPGSNDSGKTQLQAKMEIQLGGKEVGLRTQGADEAVAQEVVEGELEDVRLLYVAATRAKDHLLVSRYRPRTAKKALVLKIEEHLEGNEHLWQKWSYPGRDAPDRQRRSTARSAPESQVERDRWASDRATLVANASRPRYTTPTALKSEKAPVSPEPKVTTEQIDDEPARPGRGATELGRAVHAVLQHIDLTGWTDEDLNSLASRMAAEHNPAVSSDVARLASAALRTETMASAIAAAKRGQAWREVSTAAPLMTQAEHIGELEGQIDLIYLEQDGSVTVVDHKTDRDRGDDIEQAAEPYLPQMGAYAWCVERVTGLTVSRAVLLFASRADSGAPAEYVVPNIALEKQRAVELATEKVSAPVEAS